jgi:hypothetical protein
VEISIDMYGWNEHNLDKSGGFLKASSASKA